jgi:hypothetical protein
MIDAGRAASRPSFAGRAIGFITRVCAALVEGPNCCACGREKAETGWMLDALGGVHGFCGHCAADEEPMHIGMDELLSSPVKEKFG